MERHTMRCTRPSEDGRKTNAKTLGRLAGHLARKFEKNDVENVTADGMIDVETVLLLYKFQTAFIAGV
jgi:hypothetical protein